LGMVRGLDVSGADVTVTLTPTYSGCPALDTIVQDIETALVNAHFSPHVRTVLSPPWTTDWVRPEAREKFRALGIAPPPRQAITFHTRTAIACPRCDAHDVECLSAFGSTSCKALYRCRSCLEPFDFFKPI
jgi:ring-1,2-phenylacetyl-CoA epoxidase subunit PaaD